MRSLSPQSWAFSLNHQYVPGFLSDQEGPKDREFPGKLARGQTQGIKLNVQGLPEIVDEIKV